LLAACQEAPFTAGVLGLAFRHLEFDEAGRAKNFRDAVVHPIRRLARRTIDIPALVLGPVFPGSTGNRLAASYRRYLFGDAILEDLPPRPAIAFYATNVRSGASVTFYRDGLRASDIGIAPSTRVPLAVAVAASSAFPPFLSPIVLDVEVRAAKNVILMDGGVYDNLALDQAWDWYTTVLISDGGGRLRFREHPRRNWVSQAFRSLAIMTPQAPRLRARQAIDAFRATRQGTYWSTVSSMGSYAPLQTLPCPPNEVLALASTPTRLCRTSALLQERLINWGYAACDAAMRARVTAEASTGSFPYPAAAVG
jgi:NTE family protein